LKNLLIPILIVMLIWSCKTSQQTSKSLAGKVLIIDSTEYEITIIDPEFDTWYLMNYSPAKDRSIDFYKMQNRIGVSNWNDYYRRAKYHRVIEDQIYYDYSIDYGIEVNRKLYWYFKFVEEDYQIRLLR
jgi:hypothetical protein